MVTAAQAAAQRARAVIAPQLPALIWRVLCVWRRKWSGIEFRVVGYKSGLRRVWGVKKKRVFFSFFRLFLLRCTLSLSLSLIRAMRFTEMKNGWGSKKHTHTQKRGGPGSL